MTSIVLYGDFDEQDSELWTKFYKYCKELMELANHIPTHLSVSGNSLKTNKIVD